MTPRIITSHMHADDPHHDWCAYYYGREEVGMYGYGATRDDAIADLLTKEKNDGKRMVID
jgi:hypothetical protein